jgi:hypothetical protein
VARNHAEFSRDMNDSSSFVLDPIDCRNLTTLHTQNSVVGPPNVRGAVRDIAFALA